MQSIEQKKEKVFRFNLLIKLCFSVDLFYLWNWILIGTTTATHGSTTFNDFQKREVSPIVFIKYSEKSSLFLFASLSCFKIIIHYHHHFTSHATFFPPPPPSLLELPRDLWWKLRWKMSVFVWFSSVIFVVTLWNSGSFALTDDGNS